jgi:TPR repeat protein
LIGELAPQRKGEMDRRTCDTGYAGGCLELGIAQWKTGDKKRAVAFFDQSCGLSSGLTGCDWLGLAYLDGEGVTKDEKRGLALYRSACDRGDAESCNGLADFYTRGAYVPANPGRAVEMLDNACVLHLGEACRLLAERAMPAATAYRATARAPPELRQMACTIGDRAACKT